MISAFLRLSFLFVLGVAAASANAQSLTKSAIQVDPGNTKQTGQTFGYRLTYNCSSTSGPCIGAQVVDLLPPEVQYVSTVPASPTARVQAINVTPNFSGTGRTRVQFVMIDPLPAGNSGDLLINVRFPNGTTPNGTVATNTADGINLGTTPGTFTTPPVSVTAVATTQVTLQKTLTTSPANLDLPETYRLRIQVPNNNGALALTSIGPVVDTLPPGTVFNGATPAADCQPGCVGTTPATVTWTSPCTVPLNPNGTCDIQVNVTFPSATFPSGTNVTNSFTAVVTPLGEPPSTQGPGQVTHPVTTFVPAPGMSFTKAIAGGSPNPPTLNQTFSYDLAIGNNGNVPLDNLVVIDTLPVALQVQSVTTGAYGGLADFAAGEGVRVSYEKNTAPGTFTLWGSSPNTTTNTTLTAPPPGLGPTEYLTRVRWEYGQAQPGMTSSTRPVITGRIINPNNAGAPVAIGNAIQNCADLTAVHTAGPTNVTRNSCNNFTLSGPFAQLNPAKENLSGGGPFNPGQAIAYRLRVRSAAQSSDAVPLQYVIATDLLPVDLLFTGWTFDDQGTGLPAPQTFDQIPNYAGTGRTLLRWRWNAGSGSLGVNQQTWINISTTVRNGAASGNLANDLTLEHDAPGLGQRCSGSSQADTLDYDGDGDTAETLCRGSVTVAVAPIAQLESSKTTQSVCDAGFTLNGATLPGGQIRYRVDVQNVGTVPMNNVVLIDLLPAVGDTGVRDTSPRGSQWQPSLAAPIVPPSGTTLYYSTAANPCRGEVGGPTTGCDAPNWTTAAPEPISAVRAFKLEFGDRTIAAFDSLAFEFGMAAPPNVPAGAAYNSFAYQADRADGIGSLTAEPQKAGVTLGSCPVAPALGDYVWADTNDNGVQDDGVTGVNGVTVRLYDSGADGIAGTPDDVAVAQTVTQNSPAPSGQPGWYRFPSLTAGTWRVCIVPPPHYLPSRVDQGGNDTLDSDGDRITHCSAPVTLGPAQEIPDVDFGLVPAAALGNYVWFDRDSDGLQNEPADDGANGVTVHLYADDGDGVAEPGGGDALVATTVTALDAFGRNGYYAFRDLIPGQPYFVQFVRPSIATAFTTRGVGGDAGADSDAANDGTTQIVVLAPAEFNPDIDAGLVVPSGTLALGDQVWLDTDNDGIYEPQNGEVGIDDVELHLYRDANGNGTPDTDEYFGATATFVASGFGGRYRFDDLAPGNYIVVVAQSNFVGGAPLAGLATSTGNDPAPDPDDDVNGDDNGTQNGAVVVSRAVTLTDNGEPTSEDGNNDTNLTVDFGFIGAVPPRYDYGDAPDAGAGSGRGNYATTVFDNGAVHALAAGAPYLGDCVDADDGTAQDAAAAGDDSRGGATFGTCMRPGDDEDGVTFASPLTAGSVATFTVRAGGTGTCTLNAWVDWNANGVFNDAGEQIASNIAIASGSTNTLTPTVPASAAPGATYARFRCASTGNLDPNGVAIDGEVEDYRVEIGGGDFGDAPASYGTQGAGAAQHVVTGPDPLRLGACVDLEGDGAPSAAADGDDLAAGARYGLCFGDEDGVVFTTPVVACQSAGVDVTTNATGRLDAWIDYNRDGDFGDAGEQIFTSRAVAVGAQSLTFDVPCSSQAGNLYSRFRVSSAGGLGPAGSAPDGEVEDYVVAGGTSDFGDAPSPYPTLLADDGPRHGVVAGFSLGTTIDGEPDGQPTTPADGDGADEDGVTFPGGLLDVCATQNLTVSLVNTAGVTDPRLDAWIDLNHDGDWSDTGERIATGVALTPGTNTVPVNIACTALPGTTYARFRLASAGVATFTGAASDGEVEDYRITLRGRDYGDAPMPYPTLSASNGAFHRVVPPAALYLGACVDTESDGQPNPGDANGDDANAGAVGGGTCTGNDDEDGVVFPTPLVACRANTMTVTASAAGQFDAWIDFDLDGAFEAAERVFDHQALAAGTTPLTFNVPCDAPGGASYARVRLSTAGTNGPSGGADDGEVEDHPVAITTVDFGDAPDTYGTTLASNGPTHAITPALYLGACVDGEANGAPSVGSNGDDTASGTGSAGTCGVAGDEDGVVFGNVPTACKATPVTVTASAASRLDAWIDFNADGDFGDAGEQVFANAALVAGANALTFNVPCSSAGGDLYSRFRVSSAGGLAPTGPAADGEVEDHRILGTQQADFGDAPNTYGTTFASGGPRHAVGSGSTLFLGTCVDADSDAATPLDGSGDDAATGGIVAGTCTGNDDEDGVTFTTPLVACSAGSIDVRASEAGRLDAWIDFDRDGTFDEPAERIATSTALAAGSNAVAVNVPCSANPGSTYARFRVSASGGLGVGGATSGGEVEDHALVLRGVDWGDAPASYGTTQAGSGPSHGVVAGFTLGATIDAEADGQPNAAADGDGADEDGVAFTDGTTFAACTTHNLVVTHVNAAGIQTRLLDAWIDFDGDGRFDTPRDRVATGVMLAAGANPLAVTVPCDVTTHRPTYARFRLSSTGSATPTGAALDGEVEDYAIATAGYDYGDAPASYPTTRAQDGARHRVLETANPTLGATVDTEADGQPSAAANGDDLAGTPDDEDGVVFPSTLVPGTNGTVTLTAGATGGLVDAWIDFNADGDFADAGEQVLASEPLTAAQSRNVTFAVPVGATTGSTVSRFRISTAGALAPNGAAVDGEIEDHIVGVGAAQPSIGLAKQLANVERITSLSYRVTYDLRIANTGNVPLTNVSATDDLAATFNYADAFSIVSLTSAEFTVNPAYDGRANTQLLAPGNTLAVGSAGTVRLVVTVNLDRYFGPFENSATTHGDAPNGDDVEDTSQDGADPDPDDNGDPTDNSVPTVVRFQVVDPVAVPGLGIGGLLMLGVLLVGVATRRRTAR